MRQAKPSFIHTYTEAGKGKTCDFNQDKKAPSRST